jgi:peptidoglycan/xylan/chitin deacetylase (PgdA/CDA1 family)
MADYNSPLEDEDEGEEETSSKTNPLRAHIRKLEKELKAATGELETLRTFKTEYDSKLKATTAETVFKDLGLTEKQAALFMKVNPDTDPSPASAKAFAEEYGFTVTENDESTEEEGSFTPTPTTSGVPAPGKIWESDEWYKLYDSNPQEAMKLAAQGRVKLATAL